MKRSWLLKCLLLVNIVSQTRTESSSECSVAQTALSEFCVCVSGSQLECSGLNSTATLRTLEASSVTRLDISQSHLPCLDLSDLAGFDSLSSLSVTHSDLTQLLCSDPGQGRHHHDPVIRKLKHLSSLDVSHNKLSSLDSGLASFSRLRHLNVSHNRLRSIRPVFSAFKRLESLDLSHNRLTAALDSRVLEQIPVTRLNRVELGHNPWPCVPALSWIYSWSLTLPLHVQEGLTPALCRIVNSPSRQHAPLLTVMQYYKLKVTPDCPQACSCHFYHFAAGMNISPMATYTVIVNCSATNLTSFPSLPSQTTVLDLSHNALTQESYDMLDLARQNYLEITSLALSHNLISAIGTKLLRLKLHRAFRADNNLLTDIPYDFSLLLQKYDHNVITLGYNPWTCICNAEITDTSLQEKIRDLSDIECAEGSDPDSLAGRKLVDISSSVLCPRSEKAEGREAVLRALCGALTFLIILTISKLLYDYWNYRQRGKLPWIVYRMP